MTEEEVKKPQNSGEKVERDEEGKFVGGHVKLGGRRKGSVSITSKIKEELMKVPEGQQITYLEVLIKRILKKAIIEEDIQMIKLIWNYVDGMPRQSVGISYEENLDKEIADSINDIEDGDTKRKILGILQGDVPGEQKKDSIPDKKS